MGPNPHSCPYTTDTSRGKRRRGAWRRRPAQPSGDTGPADTPTSGFQPPDSGDKVLLSWSVTETL